jgi:hypothetical protein
MRVARSPSACSPQANIDDLIGNLTAQERMVATIIITILLLLLLLLLAVVSLFIFSLFACFSLHASSQVSSPLRTQGTLYYTIHAVLHHTILTIYPRYAVLYDITLYTILTIHCTHYTHYTPFTLYSLYTIRHHNIRHHNIHHSPHTILTILLTIHHTPYYTPFTTHHTTHHSPHTIHHTPLINVRLITPYTHRLTIYASSQVHGALA